ncbi:MAG: cytochrome c1 protein [Rubrivivax sp.]
MSTFLFLTRSWRALAVGLMALLAAAAAQAVPSYARQTGSDCAACHVGAFGPQLTPYGVAFKLNGYADTDGKDGKLPLSAMLVTNFTRTRAALTEAPDHFKTNDNTALQEASLFAAGRLAEGLGVFAQSTYSGVERKWAFDQLDLRYARPVQLGGREAVVGVSLNSNPTLTDPYNTLGQWRFPYTSSDFGFGQGATPLVENLASSVLGLNAYALVDRHWYAELGLYDTLSNKGLRLFNAEDPGRFKGLGTYARLAYQVDRKRDNFSVGLVGFHAGLQPDRADRGPADRYTDLGVDASYQFLGNREHIVAVNGSWMRERQRLNHTHAADESENLADSLTHLRLAASYHFRQTWGVTAGLFRTGGSADAGLYGGSSYSNRPDTRGYMLQADWTPWGKESSWGQPWANLRLGLQYTGYSRYNGGSHYIDEATGDDRRARDNNTTMLFAWLAF